MLPAIDTIHLLILPLTPNDAERILKQLRDSGFVTRPTLVTSYDEFLEHVQNASWDLVLIDPDLPDIDYRALVNQLQSNNVHAPVILTPKKYSVSLHEEALEIGVSDLVAVEDLTLLTLVIKKQLNWFNKESQLQHLEERLTETEKRCHYLLEGSSVPTAYIQEGTHLYANKAYLSLFGYKNFEDLIGTTLLDLIATESQLDIKSKLKQVTDEVNLDDIHCITESGDEFLSSVNCQSVPYEGGHCIQIQLHVISNKKTNQPLEPVSKVSTSEPKPQGVERPPVEDSNLNNKARFINVLRKSIDEAEFQSVSSTLIIIHIKQSESNQQEQKEGFSSIKAALIELTGKFDQIAQLSNTSLAWMTPGGDQEQAMQAAQTLSSKIQGMSKSGSKITVQIALIKDSSQTAEQIMNLSKEKAKEFFLESSEPTDITWLNNNESMILEGKINQAIKENSFTLYYQPLISLRGEEYEHYETSVKLPDELNEYASLKHLLDNEQISDNIKRRIERWMILSSIKALSAHTKDGHRTRLFITLTSASAKDDTLPAWVQVVLDSASLKPEQIVFQFTEEATLDALTSIKRFAFQLRSFGIRTSISCFSNSPTSVSLLDKVTLDYVKIAKSYTQMITENNDTSDLKGLLSSLNESGKISIVPNVDDSSIVSKIWNYDIQFVQGNYIHSPSTRMDYDFS